MIPNPLKSSFHPIRTNILLCLGIIILKVIDSDNVSCQIDWSKYRPIAMDEAWWLVTSPKPWIRDNDDQLDLNGQTTGNAFQESMTPIQQLPGQAQNISFIPPSSDVDLSVEAIGDDWGVNRESPSRGVMDVADWQGENVKDTVFHLPNRETSELTRLITQQEPTFVTNQVSRPVKTTNTGTGGEKILASYKVLVPIFVPAIKRKINTNTTKRPPVHFVKEKYTQMMAVKNMVPVVKEVIKAEEVPQQTITDYVANNALPPNVDTNLEKDDKLLKSVIEDNN